jgi:hypothetical protein
MRLDVLLTEVQDEQQDYGWWWLLHVGPGPYLKTPMHLGLFNGPFVPHYNLWEPRYITKVPEGPQTYIINILWLQKEAAQIHMPKQIQGFTSTKNMGRGFILCPTLPAQWAVYQRVLPCFFLSCKASASV